jgi:hypothetical protein
MKLLTARTCHRGSAALLRDGGLDAMHILEHGLGGTSDDRVSALSVAENRADSLV